MSDTVRYYKSLPPPTTHQQYPVSKAVCMCQILSDFTNTALASFKSNPTGETGENSQPSEDGCFGPLTHSLVVVFSNHQHGNHKDDESVECVEQYIGSQY